MDLDRFRVMGGMTINEVDSRDVDQLAGKAPLLARDLVAPVLAPVNRQDSQVAGPLDRAQPFIDLAHLLVGEVRQQDHSGRAIGRGPIWRNTAVGSTAAFQAA